MIIGVADVEHLDGIFTCQKLLEKKKKRKLDINDTLAVADYAKKT